MHTAYSNQVIAAQSRRERRDAARKAGIRPRDLAPGRPAVGPFDADRGPAMVTRAQLDLARARIAADDAIRAEEALAEWQAEHGVGEPAEPKGRFTKDTVRAAKTRIEKAA